MFKCYLHNFETWYRSEFDRHCYETGHIIEGYKNGKWFSRKMTKKDIQRRDIFDDARDAVKWCKLLESFDGIKRTNI